MAERGRKEKEMVILDSDSRFKLKEEIKEELKEEIREELGLSKKSKSSLGVETTKKERSSKPIKFLIFLVVLVLVVDFFVFFFYFKPDFVKSTENTIGNAIKNAQTNIKNSHGCSDGTPLNSCSSKKPYYCYEGELTEMASTCGCPEGYTINFQKCRKS